MFQSGISFGAGMTFKLDKEEHNGITYLDTPGLSDIKIRKQAAEAITKALKQGGTYQVFFVITLEAGRVRPEDMTTIKLTLESASDIKHFSLIINKLSTNAFDRLLAQNAEQLRIMVTELLVQINCKDNPPTVLLLQQQFKLFDKENQFINWNELNEFVAKAPSITVRSTCVEDLKGDPYSFQETLDALKSELEELRKDNERFRRMQKETDANYKRLMKLDLEEKLRKRLPQRNNHDKENPQALQKELSTKEVAEEVSTVRKKLSFFSLTPLLCRP